MIKGSKETLLKCTISEIEEKLLSNNFSVFGVDYCPKRICDPICISRVEYVPEITPSLFFNSFVMNISISLTNTNQETEMIIETSLFPVTKRIIYFFAFILVLFQIVLTVLLFKDSTGFHFSFLIPSSILLFLFVLVFAGKFISNMMIVQRINRIIR